MTNLFKIIDKPVFFWLTVIVFRILLDFSYLRFVSPVFAYSGFTIEFDQIKYVESWFYMLLFILFTPKKLNVVSDYLLALMLYGFITPIFSYYALNDQSREHLLMIMSCCSLVYLFRRGRFYSIPSIRNGRSIAVCVMVFLSVFTTLWFVYTGGFRNFNLDFTKVYEYRASIAEESYIGIMGYIIPWTTNVVGPAMMGVALYKRNYSFAIIVLGFHVLWYGFSSHKAVLFQPFLVIGLWAWFRYYKSFSVVVIIAMTVVLSSLVAWEFFGNVMYGSMFIRRVFFVIAKNTFDYFIFFSDNPKVLWSNSIMSPFLNYPYHDSPAKVIGDWRDTDAHVNNSFISTGYMHAGIFGLILYGVLGGILFRVIDSLAANYLQVLIVLSAILVPSRALVLSADLPTALLTHGIGFSILLAVFMKGKAGKIKL